MATIKTIVRELGVVYWSDKILNEDVIDPEDVTPSELYETCSKHLGDEITNADKIKDKDSFRSPKVDIIRNTYWLSLRLIETLGIEELNEVEWIGPNTQSGVPLDLIINGKNISLKEDSYILENMGLYKYINLLTNSDYNSGTWHIFEDFAENLYQEWFSVAWSFLLKKADEQNGVIWEEGNRSIEVGDQIQLVYKDRTSKLPANKLSISEYNNKTISKTRETFGKWLNDEFIPEEATKEQRQEYYSIKKKCAVESAENLIDYVEENRDVKYSNLLRLLQIYDESYYYAKSYNGTAEIYLVDSLEDYDYDKLKIKSIEADIPDSQVNIITTVKNEENGRELKLRNEVRFSHRQFNGTPEAKMYIVENYTLDAVYTELDRYDYANESINDQLTDFI